MEKISHDKIRNVHFSQNVINYYTDGHEISGTCMDQMRNVFQTLAGKLRWEETTSESLIYMGLKLKYMLKII